MRPPRSAARDGCRRDRRAAAVVRGDRRRSRRPTSASRCRRSPGAHRVRADAAAAHRVGAAPLDRHCPAPRRCPRRRCPRSGGGSGGSGSSGSGTASSGTSGPAAAATSGGAAGPTTAAERKKAARRQADATPMIAGTPAAQDLVDDESSPQLYAASQQFLAADQAIAEIGRQKQLLAQLKQSAAETAQLYRAMGYDVAGARAGRGRLAPAPRRTSAGHRAPDARAVVGRQRHPRR